MEDINSIGELNSAIVSSLLQGDSVIIPGFGYLEVKSISNKFTVLFKSTDSSHPLVKSFLSNHSSSYVEALHKFISDPLKTGKTVNLAIGNFRPIESESGIYRLSFTCSSFIKNLLNNTSLENLNFKKEEGKEELSQKENDPIQKVLVSGKQEKSSGSVKNTDIPTSTLESVKAIDLSASDDKQISQNKNILNKKPETKRILLQTKNDSVPKQKKFIFTSEKKISYKWIAALSIFILAFFIGITNIFLNKKDDQSFFNGEGNKQATNLLSLSEKHYGNSIFWVYIFEANLGKIKSPINVPDRIELQIPDLSEMNINVYDSTEINLAKIKADIILKNRR